MHLIPPTYAVIRTHQLYVPCEHCERYRLYGTCALLGTIIGVGFALATWLMLGDLPWSP